MAYRFQCKKCGADIDFMSGMEAGKTGKIKEHNCGCMEGLDCTCDWQKYNNNYDFNYDSVNRRWVKCPICKKKLPAWSKYNDGLPHSCKCGFRFWR